MPKVYQKYDNESFESLFRRFKRLVEKDGTLQEIRNREHFEKPSITRKRAKAAAKKRLQKQTAFDNMSLVDKKRAMQQAERQAKNEKGNKYRS